MVHIRLVSAIFFVLACLSLCAEKLDDTLKKFCRKPTEGLACDLVSQAIVEGQVNNVLNVLTTSLLGDLGNRKNPRLPTSRLSSLVCKADALYLLMILQNMDGRQQQQLKADAAFIKWFFGSKKRCDEFLDMISLPEDNAAAALQTLQLLHGHDSQDASDTWPLMLALAIVWDAPRPPLHDQIGPNALPFEPEIESRYDFFKGVLLSSSAPFPLGRLSVPALCFIVDTPVPVSELRWAQKHVKERNPEKLYSGIRYDHARLNSITGDISYANGNSSSGKKSAMYWRKGAYTLENIQNCGGICVDQAYFTNVVLRSRGIPSMIFCGAGTNGYHAWVAYLKTKNTWNTDVGRYKDQKFVTGQALNPMTNKSFNDHILPLVCEKLTPQVPKNQDSESLTRLARLLNAMDLPKAAQQAAEQAIKADSKDLDAWLMLLNVQTKDSGLNGVFDRLAVEFKKYPDIVTSLRLQQSENLRRKGKEKAAEAVLEKMPESPKARNDLSRDVVFAQIDAAIKDKHPEKARKLFEEYLVNQKKDGVQILNDTLVYLEFTKKTAQTKEALAFVTVFVRKARNTMNKLLKNDRIYADWDTKLLIQAYENDGNTTKAAKLKKKLR